MTLTACSEKTGVMRKTINVKSVLVNTVLKLHEYENTQFTFRSMDLTHIRSMGAAILYVYKSDNHGIIPYISVYRQVFIAPANENSKRSI